MQITEALISEPGDIRRFVQQAVDHWPRLLAVHFTLHSAEGNINGQQIQAFCTSFYRQVHERITERNHTACPSSPVVLRWLREQHGGATMRCLLLFSQELFCHPRASVTVDEECSQLVDLLQQTWQVISAGGQCRVERCFRVARPDASEQYVALKAMAMCFALPVMSTTIRCGVASEDDETLRRRMFF
ncbi:inovirus Gp2 family protein [Escherichia coli]|nr:inovirus Gp2 family protein [Escherichia coli]EFM0409350.1 inovirus Gp2 family protein [Escherichia coli]EIM6184195.1 inovirus-type Gp2 protein [Escherichia coli]EJA4574092.1 inovirus-type Gp2 protein [Escherichia coli]